MLIGAASAAVCACSGERKAGHVAQALSDGLSRERGAQSKLSQPGDYRCAGPAKLPRL